MAAQLQLCCQLAILLWHGHVYVAICSCMCKHFIQLYNMSSQLVMCMRACCLSINYKKLLLQLTSQLYNKSFQQLNKLGNQQNILLFLSLTKQLASYAAIEAAGYEEVTALQLQLLRADKMAYQRLPLSEGNTIAIAQKALAIAIQLATSEACRVGTHLVSYYSYMPAYIKFKHNESLESIMHS